MSLRFEIQRPRRLYLNSDECIPQGPENFHYNQENQIRHSIPVCKLTRVERQGRS